MYFVVAADTDVGTVKTTNQDSVCVKIAETPYGQIALAMICDGMGGLEKGELASATVINEFGNWFVNELPSYIDNFNWDYIVEKWTHMIKRLNRTIGDYGKYYGISLGTTVTAMLIYQGDYLIAHVGDSRAYEITTDINRMTEDHSVVGREVMQGLLTEEDAELDPRRNVLLQCVGASKSVNPQMIHGKVKDNASYLICSDGFRHVISRTEMLNGLSILNAKTSEEMAANIRSLIELAKARGEQDNISALLVNARA